MGMACFETNLFFLPHHEAEEINYKPISLGGSRIDYTLELITTAAATVGAIFLNCTYIIENAA